MSEVKMNPDGSVSFPLPNTTKITVEMTSDTFYEFMQFQKGVTRRSQRNQKDKIVTESDFENILLRWRIGKFAGGGIPVMGIFRVTDRDTYECLYQSNSPHGDIGLLDILKIIRGEK